MEAKNIVGKNIRKFRKALGLTQEELAFKSELSQGYVNQLESGKRRFTQKSLELISKALNTSIHSFFEELPPAGVIPVESDFGFKEIRQRRKEILNLLKELPDEIVEHYLRLLKMEIELLKE
ncbi:MAG: helix-turn-helix transcriptional regulator [Deltaproteobacteria bacterium]|nr:helix-turn-helix transcriptional regulator [Deltaproteobacteria bacterium]